MISEAQRSFLFKDNDGIYVKNMFAKVVKDYEREWLEYTLPAGTIVSVELYKFQPDIINLGGKRFLVYAGDEGFFEVLE